MPWRSYPDENNQEKIRQIIEKYFNVYEIKADSPTMAFYIHIPSDEELLQLNFNLLRNDLKKENLIPFLREQHGEFVLLINYKPSLKGKPLWVNILLLAVTIITTTLSGSILFLNEGDNLSDLFLLNNLIEGFVYFSIPLMAILGIHESGHYLVSKKHGVTASLPFFIPLPPNPFLPLGTMGALISMREPIPDRRSLLDIGIAGPISGFLVAIPVLIIGLHLSDFIAIADIPEGVPILGDNIFILLLSEIMFDIPSQYTINLHPTAFAGWVGLLITAINLLPAGQLDGGHVARAVLKENHRYASFATVLFLAGLTFFGFGNWLILLLLLVFLIGTQHPPPLNEYISLDAKRKALALLALIIFILSFTPTPVS